MALPKRQARRQGDQPARGDADWRAEYEIENAQDVDAYVGDHPTVTAILLEAPNQIRAVFGEGGVPKLARVWDPEDGDSWLTISIPADTDDETVLPLLYDLDDRWWLDRMQATDAVVVFTVIQR